MIPQPLDRAIREWRPQAFGRARRPRIVDPIVEPLWIGERVLLQYRDGAPITGSLADGSPLGAETGDAHLDGAAHLGAVLAAVAAAVGATSAVLDGYLTRQPARPPEGLIAGLDSPERPGLVRRLFLGDTRGREDAERRDRIRRAAETLAAEGLPLVFVAVDLLELDGESFLDVPLLERKRHLDSILTEGELVRIGPFVRGVASRWYGTWRASGFFEMALKAANSRYRPGEANDDWTVAAIPRR